MRRWIERQTLLTIVAIAGWLYGDSRALLRWAHARLERLDRRERAG